MLEMKSPKYYLKSKHFNIKGEDIYLIFLAKDRKIIRGFDRTELQINRFNQILFQSAKSELSIITCMERTNLTSGNDNRML